ncbi:MULTISPECIES: hypothetical protein [Chryseobacterium]|nr:MULTISPECIES: hypothetical protein [Chryseobacterium]
MPRILSKIEILAPYRTNLLKNLGAFALSIKKQTKDNPFRYGE